MFVTRRRQFKKTQLRWRVSRGARRSRGWIPLKAEQLKRKAQCLRFCGKSFRVFEQERLEGVTWRSGCWSEDAVGDWVALCGGGIPVQASIAPNEAAGVDLGLRETAVTSDGEKLQAGQFYRNIEQKIAQAQRRGHKRQAKRLNRRAARRRKEALHRFSTKIVRNYQTIVIDDVSSRKLIKTSMAKSVLDAGWGILKAQLKYKGQQASRSVYRQ